MKMKSCQGEASQSSAFQQGRKIKQAREKREKKCQYKRKGERKKRTKGYVEETSGQAVLPPLSWQVTADKRASLPVPPHAPLRRSLEEQILWKKPPGSSQSCAWHQLEGTLQNRCRAAAPLPAASSCNAAWSPPRTSTRGLICLVVGRLTAAKACL